MKTFMIACLGVVVALGLAVGTARAETPESKAALADIQRTLGFVPTFFQAFPEEGIAGAWAEFKAIQGDPKTAVPGKYKELMGLAVSFGLVVAPYAWVHDYIVLAIPWCMTIAHARQLRPSLRRTLMCATVAVAVLLWWMWAIAPIFGHGDALSVVVPMFTALLLALAVRLVSHPRLSLRTA